MTIEKSRQVLDRIAASASDEQKQALVQWADALLTIKESKTPLVKKVAESISATANFSTIKPLFVLISKELTPRELSTLSQDLLNTYKEGLNNSARLRDNASP